MRLAVRERNFDAADSLNLRYFRRRDTAAQVPANVAIVSAAGRGDSATLSRLIEIVTRGREPVGWAMRELVRALADVDNGERVARLAVGRGRLADERADGHLTLAELSLGQGRWTAAQPDLRAAEQIDPVRARLMRWAAATLPFARWPRRDLEEVERELGAWKPATPQGAASPSPVLLLLPHIRLYLLGLVCSHLSDRPRALDYAEQLQGLRAPEWMLSARDALARTVRADVAWRQGRAAEVLRLLEPVRGEVPLDLLSGGNILRLGDHVLSQEHARFLRAEALLKLGKDDEASRWLTTSFTLLPGEFLYRAPVELRLARMHDAAGRRRLALDHYQRFLSLWQNADPELQPAVIAVRRRIQELGLAPRGD